MLSSRGCVLAIRRSVWTPVPVIGVVSHFSSNNNSNNNGKDNSFRPKRRTPSWYRAIRAVPKKKGKGTGPPLEDFHFPLPKRGQDPIVLSPENDDDVEEILRMARRTSNDSSKGGGISRAEASLRMADYMISVPGTTEDLVGERRALMHYDTPEQRDKFKEKFDDMIEEEQNDSLEIGRDDMNAHVIDEDLEVFNPEIEEDGKPIDLNRKAFGPWGHCILKIDRVQKVQWGGTRLLYRALILGGNANGVAGFGVAKARTPMDALASAGRMTKRNIFFVDRYMNSGLTRDLVGKHNSCRVFLRCVPPNRGLKGHPLVKRILLHFGITDCSCKTHGNRNVYNVVRATFKAIMTHESLEDIALKTGKRLLNLDRARRLQI